VRSAATPSARALGHQGVLELGDRTRLEPSQRWHVICTSGLRLRIGVLATPVAARAVFGVVVAGHHEPLAPIAAGQLLSVRVHL
jgi:hypothetical protein